MKGGAFISYHAMKKRLQRLAAFAPQVFHRALVYLTTPGNEPKGYTPVQSYDHLLAIYGAACKAKRQASLCPE
jgi:hypothetical protein